MSVSFIQGFGIGGGLIIAIGAQNAFVLSQGVRRNYPVTIALVCALCDSVLIMLGVTGVGSAVASSSLLSQLTVWGGALFLLWYGALAFRSALQGNVLETNGNKVKTFKAVVATTLAITLLNPHVYLDTLVLLGSISGHYQGSQRILFGAGAMTASFLWFFTLSLGAGFLAPIFRKKSAWRILDGVVCLTMWSIAGSLLWNQIV